MTPKIGIMPRCYLNDIADGRNDREIAEMAGISYKTVPRAAKKIRERIESLHLVNEILDRITERDQQVRPKTV